jgi:hypothetical protein
MKEEQIVVIARKVMEEDHKVLRGLSEKISVIWYHPFSIFIYRGTPEDADFLDRNYGFCFDTVNECYFYSYDWGKGFRFRIMGFGFDVTVLRGWP